MPNQRILKGTNNPDRADEHVWAHRHTWDFPAIPLIIKPRRYGSLFSVSSCISHKLSYTMCLHLVLQKNHIFFAEVFHISLLIGKMTKCPEEDKRGACNKVSHCCIQCIVWRLHVSILIEGATNNFRWRLCMWFMQSKLRGLLLCSSPLSWRFSRCWIMSLATR